MPFSEANTSNGKPRNRDLLFENDMRAGIGLASTGSVIEIPHPVPETVVRRSMHEPTFGGPA